MEVPPALLTRIRALLGTNVSSFGDAEGLSFIEQTLEVCDACIALIDSEQQRVAEAKFSAPDPASLRSKLVGEPRRQAEQALAALKQRVAQEKQEWVRRVAKQLNDVQSALEGQVEQIRVMERVEGASIVLSPDDDWLKTYDDWRADTYASWAAHLGNALPVKTRKAVQPELEALSGLMKQRLSLPENARPQFVLPLKRGRGKEYRERFDVATSLEAFFNSFKERLNTVAMIAGLVVIPVVGGLMTTASTTIRAVVMGAALTPILVFSFYHGRKHRKQLFIANLEKASDRLRKVLLADAKLELERFKLDAERYTAAHCNAAQQALASALDPLIAEHFEALERQTASRLANAQLEADRATDQVNILRQLKSSLTGQLMLELKRRQIEAQERAPSP